MVGRVLLADKSNCSRSWKKRRWRSVAWRQSCRLRVDLHGTLAKHFVIPASPQFMACYPDIELSLSEADRQVDLAYRRRRLRAARRVPLGDSTLIGKRVANLRQITCASSAICANTANQSLALILQNHRAVNERLAHDGQNCFTFEFMVDGERKEVVSIAGAVSVFGALDLNAASAVTAGQGPIQCPHYRMETQIAQGLIKKSSSRHRRHRCRKVSAVPAQPTHVATGSVNTWIGWGSVFADAG